LRFAAADLIHPGEAPQMPSYLFFILPNGFVWKKPDLADSFSHLCDGFILYLNQNGKMGSFGQTAVSD
jgi:hypothetical protein